MADAAEYNFPVGARTSKSPPSAAGRESTASAASAPRVRRRNRVIASCLECRRRKLKCDKLAPCTNCTKLKRDCLYLSPALDSASQQKLAEIKDRMGTLEQSLERDVARQVNTSSSPLTSHIKIEDPSSDEDDTALPEDERNLEPTPLATLDQVYEDDADDDLMDLGVQLGKMRISDRIGGFARPKFAEEIKFPYKRLEAAAAASLSSPPAYDFTSPVHNWLLADPPSVYLGPGAEYLAPASSFFFPAPQTRSKLREYLPTKSVCDTLMKQYWHAVHPVATVVHRPSFNQQYEAFWSHITHGSEPPASLQAIIFAACFTAAVSSSDAFTTKHFGVPKTSLIERFQSIVEISLSRANFLRTTKLETMQALVIYLIPLCRAEISRSHSALCGTAVRLAECMGLHRDGSHYSFSAVETHVRRLIWYHLCFLDMRTCEATGPRPQIRSTEFDTQMPLNVNEVDLMRDPAPTEDSKGFTDMTLSKIRFQCTEMFRQVWADIPRLDQKKVKLSHLMNKIQKFRNDMDATYLPMLNGSDGRQILALHVYRILSNRLSVMLLHRYFTNAKAPMPDRLRKILIDACLGTTEFAISLETRPETIHFTWYRGAIMQHHTALLLLLEVNTNAASPEAARIWKCLDYVYEVPPNLTAQQKSESIYYALKHRLLAFQSMRKTKASKLVEAEFGVISQTQTTFPDFIQRSLEPSVTSQMDPQHYASPPMRPPESESTGSQNGTSQGGNIAADLLMQDLDDIDWNEWDKFFPSNNTSMPSNDFNNMDFSNVNFDMGTYNAYTSMDPHGAKSSLSPSAAAASRGQSMGPITPESLPPMSGVLPNHSIDFSNRYHQ